MEDKGKRLSDAIEYLKNQGVINNLEDVAVRVDRSKNNISSAINGDKRYLSDKFLKHFNACFKNIFSPDWLLRGIGNMFDGCGCTPPENPSLYSRTSSASNDGVSTEAQRPHNGGTTDLRDERIKLLEEKLAFREEQLDVKDATIAELQRKLAELSEGK